MKVFHCRVTSRVYCSMVTSSCEPSVREFLKIDSNFKNSKSVAHLVFIDLWFYLNKLLRFSLALSTYPENRSKFPVEWWVVTKIIRSADRSVPEFMNCHCMNSLDRVYLAFVFHEGKTSSRPSQSSLCLSSSTSICVEAVLIRLLTSCLMARKSIVNSSIPAENWCWPVLFGRRWVLWGWNHLKSRIIACKYLCSRKARTWRRQHFMW